MDENNPALPNRQVLRLTIDPDDHDVVYASFSGFSPDNLWRTTDGGATWTDITGAGATGLPDAPVRDLDIHPDNANFLYAATEVGVFTSEDGGANWTVPHDGPANVSVDELFWMDRTLVAATHGRGLFEASPCVAPGAVTDVQESKVDASTIRLDWTAVPGADQYEVWDAINDPYFDPAGGDCSNPAPYACTIVTTNYHEDADLGDPAENHSYIVLASNSCGVTTTALSNDVGEFDYALTPGTP